MPDVISQAQLAAFLPALPRADEWTTALNAAMDRFEINTPPRAAAFLAQVAHESGDVSVLISKRSIAAFSAAVHSSARGSAGRNAASCACEMTSGIYLGHSHAKAPAVRHA